MTSNQIDYYNARMKAKNDRLTRKETKRHNKVQERAQNISAQAALTSAGAAASQAATAQRKYELEWVNEWGVPYGSDPYDPSNYYYDEKTGAGLPRGATTQSYVKKQYEIMVLGEQGKTEKFNRAQKVAQAASNFAKGVKDVVGSYFMITGG